MMYAFGEITSGNFNHFDCIHGFGSGVNGTGQHIRNKLLRYEKHRSLYLALLVCAVLPFINHLLGIPISAPLKLLRATQIKV